ncbi:MAG TPA: hypothetical protein VK831_00195 [Candidatus Deferrimicrobiaceae bacterium]|nr:hypothetical protein [Candidatus Deferrimicrobiaceae bacterium]
MTAALGAVLVAIWLGAVIAVSARDQWTAAIGLAIALVAAPLLADPLPSPALLGSLIIAGLLAAALVRTSAPARPEAVGAGWPAEALLATAGAFAGLGIAFGLGLATIEAVGLGGPGPGGAGAEVQLLSPEGLAAAGAGCLLAVALAPALTARAGPRHAAALVLLVEAVLLFRTAVAGAAVELEVVAWAALMVAVAAVGSVLTRLELAPAEASAPAPDEPAWRRG